MIWGTRSRMSFTGSPPRVGDWLLAVGARRGGLVVGEVALCGAPGHGRVERGGELAPGDRLAGGSKPLEDWPGGADGAPRLARADRPSAGGAAGLEGEQPDHQPDQQVDAGQ